jgi:O-succinylhomoserine sulfhydrylase
LAHACGALVIVDNTLLTPILQSPLKLGADVVVHSAGKYIDGHGRCIAGIVLGSERLMNDLRAVNRAMGATLSPMDAWLLLKSIETLELRINAINQNAIQIALWLRTQQNIGRVYYTGLPDHPQYGLACSQQSGHGGVLSFEVGSSIECAWRMIDSLKLISIATSIGDTRTMVTHPASTTHGKLSIEERSLSGVNETLVRLSVGLESLTDLISDLKTSLASVQSVSRGLADELALAELI